MNLNKFGRWSGIVVAVAMLAMVLQGCGGDDNGADQDLSDQLAMLQGELDAANAARMTADQAAADAMAAQTAAEAAQADAEMERDEANIARGAAETAKMVAEAAQADAEMAQAAADQAAADAMAAQMAADAARMTAETDRDNYKMMAEAAETARMAAETAKMAAETAQTAAETAQTAAETAQATAEMERDQANTAKTEADQAAADAKTAQTAAEAERDKYKMMLADLQGDIDTDEMTDASAAAKALLTKALAPANVTMAAVDAVDAKVGNDGYLAAEVEDYTLGDMPDMIEGWMGATLMHKDGNTIVVYSDRGASGGMMFLDTYTGTVVAGTRTYTVDDETDADTDPATGEIHWRAVKRTDTSVGSGSKPGSSMFEGSVMDVPGTFSCEGTCTAPPRHSDGTVDHSTGANFAGAWMFVPDDPNARIAGADSEYLTFGWWLMKDATGMPESLQLIANAMGMGDARTTTDTEGDDLRGTATYKGAAAGKYAVASTTDQSYEGGHFTAMATITADFDVDNDATDDAGNDRDGIKLSGMIDNFMTGDMSRPDWMVELMADGNVPSDGVATDENRGLQPVDNLVGDLAEDTVVLSTEWTMGTAQVGVGTWNPTFSGTETDTDHPKAVTGTFNASLGAASRLQGAFGANKTDE